LQNKIISIDNIHNVPAPIIDVFKLTIIKYLSLRELGIIAQLSKNSRECAADEANIRLAETGLNPNPKAEGDHYPSVVAAIKRLQIKKAEDFLTQNGFKYADKEKEKVMPYELALETRQEPDVLEGLRELGGFGGVEHGKS